METLQPAQAVTPHSPSTREVSLYMLRLAALTAIYYFSGRWGLSLHAVNGFATPIWAPTGISLAALMIFGMELWPGVMLGAFLVNTTQGASIPLGGAFAIGNTLEALVGCYLLRLLRFRLALNRVRDIFSLFVGASVVSPVVSATLGTLALVAARTLSLSSYLLNWKVWWAGDMLSNLIIAPFLMVWWVSKGSLKPTFPRWVEAGILGGSLVAVANLVFARPFSPEYGHISFPYLIFPPLIGIALRFGPAGAVTATFGTSLWALWYTVQGKGPFAFPSLNEHLLSLQLFMGVTAITSLVFAALASERAESRRLEKASEQRLRQSHEELERRVEERTRELVEANARLRENEERFSHLVDDVQDYAIFGLDTAGYVFTWNAGAQRALGYTANEILGKHFSLFYPAQEMQKGKPESLLQRAAREERIREEGWRIRKDGSRYFAEVVITALRGKQGELIGYTKITRDMTERRQLDERLQQKEEELFQSRKLEAVGRLAGGVAHDFNNLLTGILGICQDLKQSFTSDDARRDDIDEVIKASNRAFDVTRQLLTFSRRQVTTPVIIDVSATIRDFSKLLQRLIGEDIHLEIHASEDSRIKMDPGNLEQVLLNLVLNARDAMTRGGIITIRTTHVELDSKGLVSSPQVLLEVSDTGKGMDEVTLSHIFEPFYTTKTHDKGTGLGLATVYGIIKQSQGEITVNSQEGKGTTFRIYLPRVLAASEQARPVKTKLPAEGHELVLVVEDEDIVRRVVVKRLTQAGYNVLEASDGEKALELVRQHGSSIHLVVTDVVMPSMNGREVIQRIRARHPGIAVLYMSGYPEDIIARRGTLEPGINFIEKSLIQRDLVKTIREVLDKAAASSVS